MARSPDATGSPATAGGMPGARGNALTEGVDVTMARCLPCALVLLCCSAVVSATELRTEGGRFTLDGKPAFLLGVSYYGGLGASEEQVAADLDDLAARGINWVRLWATWAFEGRDVSAVTPGGEPRQPYLDRLVWLVRAADERGIVVDVTLNRTNGGESPGGVADQAGHLRAVEVLTQALLPLRNCYIDLANERNIGDARHVSIGELRALRDAVKALDPARLVTASQGGDISEDEVREYVEGVGVDFLCPHRPRHRGSPGETREQTERYRAWLEGLGHVMPVHYQEPFRRGYGDWQPDVEGFLTDLRGALEGGAAGWCLHNGSPRDGAEGPTRSFDMGGERGRLMEQLDPVEREVLDRMAETVAER